jgi:hypothetical protein
MLVKMLAHVEWTTSRPEVPDDGGGLVVRILEERDVDERRRRDLAGPAGSGSRVRPSGLAGFAPRDTCSRSAGRSTPRPLIHFSCPSLEIRKPLPRRARRQYRRPPCRPALPPRPCRRRPFPAPSPPRHAGTDHPGGSDEPCRIPGTPGGDTSPDRQLAVKPTLAVWMFTDGSSPRPQALPRRLGRGSRARRASRH